MKHIVLVGFMGSGKSTVAFRLSYKLKRCYMDTDKLIESSVGMKIAKMFEEKGEAYFREKETECLKNLSKEKGLRIISLGGGTPIKVENRKLIKNLGTVIYLKASPEAIYKRLKHDKSRPLLRTENPLQTIKDMIAARNSVYEEVADYIVNVDYKESKEVVDKVMAIVQKLEKEKK